jgi:hypothetical protein
MVEIGRGLTAMQDLPRQAGVTSYPRATRKLAIS